MTKQIKFENKLFHDIKEANKELSTKEVLELINSEDKVQFINEKEQDITSLVLARLFLQSDLKTKQNILNSYAFKPMVNESKNLEQAFQKLILGGIGLASYTGEKLQEFGDELVKRGEKADSKPATTVKNWYDQSSVEVQKFLDKATDSIQKQTSAFVNNDKVQKLEEQIQKLQSELTSLKKDKVTKK